MRRLQSALQSGVVLLALTGLTATAHATETLAMDAELSLAEVTAATLAHSPEKERLEARRAHAKALGERAGNPLDGAPSVGFSHQTDALCRDTDMREWEGSVELPLRRPGLQAAAERQAEGRLSATEQQSTAWRLTIARLASERLAPSATSNSGLIGFDPVRVCHNGTKQRSDSGWHHDEVHSVTKGRGRAA